MLAESHFYFHKAADVLGLSDKVRTILFKYAGFATRQAGKVTL
jgi:hypothetical protein